MNTSKRWLAFCLVLMTFVQIQPRLISARASAPQAGATVLPNFVDELVVSGLLSPRAFVFTPDNRVLILERGNAETNDLNYASVRVFKNGALLPLRALSLSTCGDGERGALGLALDPGFSQNGYFYVYYTRWAINGSKACGYDSLKDNVPGPRNRVSRFTLQGDVADPDSEKILIDSVITDIGIHNAGDLHFGADGYLYVSTGDSGLIPSPAQFLNNLNGKILRIKPTEDGGYSTLGNPFNSQANAVRCGANAPVAENNVCAEVFAYGLRNPFRFAVNPYANSLFVGDVGGGAWEEVSEVVAGGNYGYPSREGPCPGGIICTPPSDPYSRTDDYGNYFYDPIYAYDHTSQSSSYDAAIIGGDFYTGSAGSTSYPIDYIGDYFFADIVRNFIQRLQYDPQTATWKPVQPNFATNVRGIVGLKRGNDGNLYYLTYMSDDERTSEIRRIRYSPGANQPPVAVASVSPSGGALSTPFVFSGNGSSDPENQLPLTFHWNFGDGMPAVVTTSLTVSHVYATANSYTATLVVQDKGMPSALSEPAYVRVFLGNLPPTATLILTNTTSPARTQYFAGDTWQFGAANASDDEPLPDDAFLWSVIFHHREHTHPFLSGIETETGNFTVPSNGEPDPVVWYEVILRLKDKQGQTTTLSRSIKPELSTLTFQTQPANGKVIIDGATFSSPLVITRVVGIASGIAAPVSQTIGINYFQFQSWSPNVAQPLVNSQMITVPQPNSTFTVLLGKTGELPGVKKWLLPLVKK